MSVAYSFSAIGKCLRTAHSLEARCIFFDGRMPISELMMFDELEQALKKSETLPDCVLILADAEVLTTLCSHWDTANSIREQFLARGSREGFQYVKSYHFVEWSPSGLSIREQINGSRADQTWDIPVDDFVYQGIYYLVQQNSVVQRAPAGHVFKHPSGTINNIFIQAKELAMTEPQVGFLGRAICHAFKPSLLENIELVFVDTMSIYSFVREALDFCGSNARVESFHSYYAIEQLAPPDKPYLVVISASTTGGMARRLHNEQSFDLNRLLTLIDMSASDRSGGVLVALDKLGVNNHGLVSDGTDTEIELVGEHFSSKAKPPRAVTLGIPHRPLALEKILSEFGLDAVQPINSVPPNGRRRTIVSLDGIAIARNSKVQSWFKDEIDWNLPGTINIIIHTDDPGSKELAEKSAEIINSSRQTLPLIVNYTGLMARGLADATGVLIITAVAGDGGLLREISRDLRELIPTKLPRHFMIGVGLPQNADAWSRLGQFLTRNSTPRSYGFSSWEVLPVGADGSQNAWNDLSTLASAGQVEMRRVGLVDSNIADASISAMVNCITGAANQVLSKSDGSPLALSEGFLFFGNAFNGRLAEVSTQSTYIAVTSVLQTARDLKSATSRLRATGYESVVLDPENFLRFNDNLLQACFLRAAHTSELNYCASPHLSTLMKELLLKIFERHKHPYGAAALEFAAALASGRMRLKQEDTDELVEKTVELLKGDPPSPLLGFLLMTK